MCTNFTPTQNREWVKATLGVELPSGYPAEVFPAYSAPIAVRSHKSGRVACGLASFGLIPHWAKDLKIGRHTYNARVETVATKPSYRDAWAKRQFGLVLVDNFFEPHYGSGKPERWKIERDTGEPFGIACLWEQTQHPQTQQPLVSFTMLTVNADQHPIMNQFHKPEDEKRTPVVIPQDRFQEWLSVDVVHAKSMLALNTLPSLRANVSLRQKQEFGV
jgi:putative SOS response-associated peptidase YedK